MAATYPANIKTNFTVKEDNVDIVYASHVNLLQEEVVAIETTVGTNPQSGTNTYTSSGYSVGTSHTNLTSRLTNMEVGITGDVHTQYAKLTGGSVIVPLLASVKGLVVKGTTSQTANLQEWQVSGSSTPVAYVSPTGGITDTKITPALDNLYVLSYVFG